MKKLKTKNEAFRRNRPVVKSMESVRMLEESLWWESFVKAVAPVGLEPGVTD